MPQQEIPDSLNDSSGSSLSSNSSLRNINLERDVIPYHRRRNSANSPSPPLNEIIERVHIVRDRDPSFNPNNDEEFYQPYNPNQPYLFPIHLPHQVHFETTLDVLLRSVTGRNDLINVESIKLRVISASVSLYTLAVYMPNLTSLNLEGSVLCSLRDLGYNLVNLQFLNVTNCGLTSLDGTGGFPAVEQLIADKNMIQLVSPLQNLTELKKFSLRDNQVTNLNWLTFLGACSLLADVDLRGNPVTKNPYYRATLTQSMPMLAYLDGVAIKPAAGHAGESISADDQDTFSPSTLSEDGGDSADESLKSDLNNSLASFEMLERPSTSHGVCVVRMPDNKRPSTATALDARNRRKMLTSGPPLCGSITSLVRRKRSNVNAKTAWKESTDESSSSSPLSSISPDSSISAANFAKSKSLLEKSFPPRLPQLSVDLDGSEAMVVESPKEEIKSDESLS